MVRSSRRRVRKGTTLRAADESERLLDRPSALSSRRLPLADIAPDPSLR
eukprot:COSAG02_NODE_47716_length_339_cov_0.650000_1_plen_48_part_01